MEKIFWEKEKGDVLINELMAYTLAKLGSFAWVRRIMFYEDDLFRYSPSFSLRYRNNDLHIYAQLFECIHSFKGNVEWTMYKGKKNYTIEPNELHFLRLVHGSPMLEEVLTKEYSEFLQEAIKDVKDLCIHIEDYFDIANEKPKYPERD